MQKAMVAMLAPLAHATGCRATYPQLSRSVVPPTPEDVEAARLAR
jgi:hypothetical protein